MMAKRGRPYTYGGLESVHLELPILAETDKAYKVGERPDVWLPKSQVVVGEKTGSNIYEFEVPGGIAIEKGLA